MAMQNNFNSKINVAIQYNQNAILKWQLQCVGWRRRGGGIKFVAMNTTKHILSLYKIPKFHHFKCKKSWFDKCFWICDMNCLHDSIVVNNTSKSLCFCGMILKVGSMFTMKTNRKYNKRFPTTNKELKN